MDYYKILGVTKQADEEQIKQAYRRLARKYHPDLNPDDPAAEAKFKDAAEAYETLGDAEKRREYDLKRKGTGDISRSREKYFGFSFGGGEGDKQTQSGGGKKNPLDVTEMFEAFMKIK